MKAKIVFINLFLPITKKIFLLTGIFALLNVMTLQAQVTIGENREPNANAVLELVTQGNNKGFLPPKVALVAPHDFRPLSAHVEGMIVYNTTILADSLQKGLYINNGTQWVALQQTPYSAPTWFYMPSYHVSTSSAGTFTVDLWAEYDRQFDNTAPGSLIVSSNAAAPSPFSNVYAADELNYYVTKYDNTVFSNVTISPTGLLSYTITPEGLSHVSDSTYMNIMFVEKQKGNNINTNEQKLVPVTFRIEFAGDTTGLRSDAALHPNSLFYIVYNTDTGDRYKRVNIDNLTGVINDSLPEGNYTIVFVSANGVVETPWSEDVCCNNIIKNNIINYGRPSIVLASMGNLNNNSDCFYKKYYCLVEQGTSNDNTVILERIFGKIEIALEDIFPWNVQSIDFQFSVVTYDYQYSLNYDIINYRSGGLFVPDYVRQPIFQTEWTATNVISFIDFVNPGQSPNPPLSIKLTVWGTISIQNGSTVFATKVINNVDLFKNKTVRYTGKVLDGITDPPNSGFTMTVSDW